VSDSLGHISLDFFDYDRIISLDFNGTNILPFEVKAGVQGGMKSLWDYMRERKLSRAIRCSLENFGEFDYIDDRSATKGDACQSKKAEGAVRHVRIFPLYAINVFHKLSER
jgi:hypothetical protein